MSRTHIDIADKDAVRAQIDRYVRAALAGDAEAWGNVAGLMACGKYGQLIWHSDQPSKS